MGRVERIGDLLLVISAGLSAFALLIILMVSADNQFGWHIWYSHATFALPAFLNAFSLVIATIAAAVYSSRRLSDKRRLAMQIIYIIIALFIFTGICATLIDDPRNAYAD